MYVSQIGNINNAAFGIQQNNSNRMALANSAGAYGNISTLHQAEKLLQLENLQNQFTYNYSSAMEEKQKKQEKENIKRSFSTFA